MNRIDWFVIVFAVVITAIGFIFFIDDKHGKTMSERTKEKATQVERSTHVVLDHYWKRVVVACDEGVCDEGRKIK